MSIQYQDCLDSTNSHGYDPGEIKTFHQLRLLWSHLHRTKKREPTRTTSPKEITSKLNKPSLTKQPKN